MVTAQWGSGPLPRGPISSRMNYTMTTVKATRNKARGKSDERDVARILGGTRHPADTGGDEDVEHHELAVQVKGGLRVANDTIRNGLKSAQSKGNGKLPALVLVDRAGTRVNRYILFDLQEFSDWRGYGQ